MALLMDMCRPDPQYLAASVREAKCTRLGYMTRLSRLHTLDHHYKTCKEIMSKETIKQIFLYSTSK
jgi:hypothetical protein